MMFVSILGYLICWVKIDWLWLINSITLKTLFPYHKTSFLPNIMTTLIIKTTPHFCYEWQRVNHWEKVISSSLVKLEASSLSPSPPSKDSTEGLGEGEGVNHQDETISEQCGQSWCSSDTSHQKDGQDDYQNQHTCA